MEANDETFGRLDFEAVVLANGDFPTAPVPLRVLQGARFLCCCDEAAVGALGNGFTPDAIVGDGDSLPEAFKERYASMLHLESEQEDNDLTKATRFCMGKGFRRIAYVGATGKREDHTLGNISLLARYASAFGIEPTMFTDHGWFRVVNGNARILTFPRQQISLFNISCRQIESTGLKWKAYPYRELWQGTLNEAKGNVISLETDGMLVVFLTYSAKKP